MANKALQVPVLRRGKACLRCRKRKMKCDGAKPACDQCVRAKKADHCEFDDGKGKTRTQLMREQIIRLEKRIRELEGDLFMSPGVVLYDPHAHSHSGSSSCSIADPSRISHPDSPFSTAASTTTSPDTSWSSLHSVSSSTSPFVPDFFLPPQHSCSQTPPELARVLLDIFSPHCRQYGLDVHMGRVLETLNSPPEEQRHPVLMNAMFMWACFMSRPEPLSQHEEHYLALTLDALPSGLRVGEKIVDIIQGSCLLSLYFLVNGRFLEGSYHASAAATIALQFGFHLNAFSDLSSPWDSPRPIGEKLSRIGVQEGEQILAFWQVYNLDRCWSAVLRKPLVIPDSDSFDPQYSISCPWPQDLAEYEMGNINLEPSSETVKAFLRGEKSESGYSTQALRAKASALYARAVEFSNSNDWQLGPLSPLLLEVQSLETTISHFIADLMPPHQFDSLLTEDKHTLLVVYTLVHTALMHIYRPLVSEDVVFSEKCLNAASACFVVINLIGKQEYNYLDPIVGPCWVFAAETILEIFETQKSSWSVLNTVIQTQIKTILCAIDTLGLRLPIVAIAATKVRQRLADL